MATTNDIIERYITLRDMKADIEAATKKKLEQINEALDRIEAHLLATFQAAGQDSVSTPAGTAFLSTTTSVTTADWKVALAWVIDGQRWEFIEKKFNKTAVADYKEQHADLPPGINWREEKVIRINRPRKDK